MELAAGELPQSEELNAFLERMEGLLQQIEENNGGLAMPDNVFVCTVEPTNKLSHFAPLFKTRIASKLNLYRKLNLANSNISALTPRAFKTLRHSMFSSFLFLKNMQRADLAKIGWNIANNGGLSTFHVIVSTYVAPTYYISSSASPNVVFRFFLPLCVI